MPTRPQTIAATSLAFAGLVLAACSSGSTKAASNTSAQHSMTESQSMTESHSMTESPSMSAHPAAAPIGSDCGMIPTSGMGSMHGMSMDPLVTAAAHNPLITTFAAQLKEAGMTGFLNASHNITVFAPENKAFSSLPSGTMNMLHNQTELANILKNHVVDGQITPADIASGKKLTTLAGGTLTPSKMGSAYEINDAHVLCGNLQTENATIYIIDTVLTPQH